ncbi:MAG: DUF4340 domain-containing protein [Alphaproteobacteria bacterium]|nr:MAG: DUF4340 domain-containing protein [Alphaproteobacteria bacterium]
MSERLTNILGYLTLIAILAAIWVLFGEDPTLDQGARGEHTFADAAEHINDTVEIRLVAGDAATALKRGDDGVWQVVDRAGFPADADKVRAFLRGIALSERRDPKTDDKDSFDKLGLGAAAVNVTLLGAREKVLAAFDQGIRKDGGSGRSLTYVYQVGDTRAWLVTGLMEADANPADWLAKKIVDIEESRFARLGLGAVVMNRELGHENYTIENLEDGEEPAADWVLREPSRALAYLSVLDVQKLANPLLDPTGTVKAVTHDGLVLSLVLYDMEGATWAQVAAEYFPTLREEGESGVLADAPEDGAAEAAAINARTAGWLFKLSDRTGELLTRKREEFLKAKPEADAGDTPAS